MCYLKKLSLILLLIVYGLSSSGMTVNFHYCCGKLKKVEFSSVQVECGMKMKHSSSKKCCDNKQVHLKVKDDQKITEGVTPAFKAISLPISFSDLSFAHFVSGGNYLIPSIFAPPPLLKQLYIFHCVYRI